MANERLRASMSEAQVTVEEVADACEVDPKTVQRWLSGRRPYRRHRWQVARILRDDEQYLWPPESVGPGAEAACTEEIIAAYPHRALLPTSTWWRLFESATERIDLLGYAMLHLPEQHPGLMELLRDKGRDGCQVRIALADPEAEIVVQRDEEEQLEEGLLARIRTAIKYYGELEDADGVELRLHGTPLYSSLFAFDHELLVTPHLYRTPGSKAPLLHLRRRGPDGLYANYLQHFARVWDDASGLYGTGDQR
ncbi:helix-turn-helix domain-containing protein [Nitriliruptor alkaliphilus]|uniref:helix-turn-helix domain-containing protein n=1 Tax=Nitriliruptor alkaliphilus TaxID=427918 RepID=UPI000698ACFE|nr:helix-turn-helix transcriptional regulator [Nitriliruptor alkaliphilus]